MTERNTQCYFVYDNKPLDSLFVKNLQATLSPTLSIKEIDLSERMFHSPFAVDWLEIALIFTSTTIATGILTKVGEDIYDKLKDTAKKAQKRRQFKKGFASGILRLLRRRKGTFIDLSSGTMRVTISINAGEVLVQGRVNSDDYETLLSAIALAKQMIDNAQKQQAQGEEEIRKNNSINYEEYQAQAMQTPAFQAGLWFVYEFDVTKREWTLKEINLYKPDSKGKFYGTVGEPDRVRHG